MAKRGMGSKNYPADVAKKAREEGGKKGGKRAHELGTAHEFDHKEAVDAGRNSHKNS